MATGADIEVNVFQSTFPSLSTQIAIAQFLHHTLGLLHFLKIIFWQALLSTGL